MVSWLHTFTSSSCTRLAENSGSAFSNSDVILSMPGDFPFFSLVMASSTSPKVGSLTDISSINSPNPNSTSSSGPMGLSGCSLFNTSLKCSVHLSCMSSFVLRRLLSLSNTAVLCLGLSSHSFLVNPYKVFISWLRAAFQLQILSPLTISFCLLSNFASLLCLFLCTFSSTALNSFRSCTQYFLIHLLSFIYQTPWLSANPWFVLPSWFT